MGELHEGAVGELAVGIKFAPLQAALENVQSRHLQGEYSVLECFRMTLAPATTIRYGIENKWVSYCLVSSEAAHNPS